MEIFTGGLACSEHREVPQLEGRESQVVVMWMNIKLISTDVEMGKTRSNRVCVLILTTQNR